MKNRRVTTLITALAILALASLGSGCKRVKENHKALLLEQATSGYRQALRWGYYDAALSFIHPERRANLNVAPLENVRVTSYEVIQAPSATDATALETVRIEYVLNDRQRLEALIDEHEWHYDEATGRWWLHSDPPAFAR